MEETKAKDIAKGSNDLNTKKKSDTLSMLSLEMLHAAKSENMQE